MTTSSLALGAAGIAASFAPAELLSSLGAPSVEPLPVLIQLLGALYIGFALTNWTAKDSIIGGIYSRPIAIGNCVHFISGALALAKQQLAHGVDTLLLPVLLVYAILALSFTWLIFGFSPAQQRSR